MNDNSMNRGYIYRHILLDTGVVFYIGIGGFNKKEKQFTYKRAYDKLARHSDWKKITLNTNYIVEIILDNLTEIESILKEIEFIKLYGRLDLGTGTLINKNNGGQGFSGTKRKPLSDETKEKISKTRKEKYALGLLPSMKGDKNPMFGKITPNETKEKLRVALSGDKNPFYGKKHTEETLKKLSEINKGENAPNYGKPCSEETKKKLREIKGENHPNFGKKHTDETKRKISETLKSKKH